MFSVAACVDRGLRSSCGWNKPALLPTKSRFWLRQSCPSSCSSSILRMSAQKSGLQIVFVTTEVAPWSKVGGLADVLSALPPALAARDHRVMVVSPRYAEYEDTINTGTSVPVLLPLATSSHSLSGDSLPPGDSLSSLTGSQEDASAPLQPGTESATQACEVQPSHQKSGAAPGTSIPELTDAKQQQGQATAQYYLCQRSGVDHVFVDHPLYCRTSDIYGSSNVNTYQEAGDFPDLDLRYSILCQAALAAPLLLWQNSARTQPQHRLAEKPCPGEEDAPEQGLAGGGIRTQACGRLGERLPVMPQLHAQLPEALKLEPAGDTPASMSPAAHGAAGSSECCSAAASSPVTAKASASPGSATDAAVHANLLHLQGSNPAALSQADIENNVPSAMPQNRGAHAACQQADTQHTAAASRLQGSRSGAEPGQAGQPGDDRAPLVFVSSDWPCAPLALRLKHTLQSAWTPSDTSVLPRCASKDEEAAPCSASGSSEAAETFWAGQSLRDSVRHARTAFCIHNLAYQGFMPLATFPRLCLPDDALPPLLWPPVDMEGGAASSIGGSASSTGRLSEGARTQSSGSQKECQSPHAETQGKAATSVNWMHAALREHDLILTVSPGYALEICRDAAMACGMQDVLQRRGVRGIMNGLDTKEWDPACDRFLPHSARFEDAAELAEAKAHAKAVLQREQGLMEDPEAPIVAYVGRLAAQKGMDVLLSALPALFNAPHAQEEKDIAVLDSTWDEGVSVGVAAKKVQVVILGTGEAWMQHAIAAMGNSFRGRAAGIAKFDERTAHLLMAAADYVIIPSRFEPCGLVAQSAARYGAVPIVTAVGGLKDFVTDAVGYAIEPFGAQHSVPAQRKAVADLLAVVRDALSQHGSQRHKAMQEHCVALNLSWDKAATDWEDALLSLCCPT